MTSDTPEPQPPDGSGAEAAPGSPPRAPRVLVSVDDFEDPAEWDVIVVENEAVDDETARRIARQRSAKERRPRAITLPSLDEQDVIKAFDTDRDAEAPDNVSVEAFEPPEPLPVRRRPVADIPLPVADPFAGLPEPEPEPRPQPEGAADVDGAFHPESLAPIAEPGPPERPATDPRDGAPGVERAPAGPAENDPAAPEDPHAPPAGIAGPAAAAGAAGLAAAASASPAAAAEPQRPLVDDPEDGFFAIGDGTQVVPEPATEGEWAPAPEGLDADRELVDDPRDDFYDVGPAAEDAEERARLAEVGAPEAPPAAGEVPVALDPAAGVAPDAPAPAAAAAESFGDDFEDEVEFDSSFPLGPDDLAVAGELEPVDLGALDYAAVFGPVQGKDPDPAHQPARRRAAPAYEDDLFLGDRHDDDDARYVVAPARSRGRRRELVALGIAAGVMVAIGIGSQIYGGDDAGLEAGDEPTTSTSRERVRATTPTTQSELTLPSLPTDGAETTVAAPSGTRPRQGRVTPTTERRGATATTARRAATPPTAAPTTPPTQPPPPPSTAPPATAAPTTTAPPATTTTAPQGP